MIMTLDVEKIFQDYGAAWASRDLEKILSFYNDDCVYEVPSGITNRNRHELRQFFEKLLTTMPDVKFESISFFYSGNMICAEYFIKGTVVEGDEVKSGGDRQISIQAASIYELKKGKFSRVTNYYNL